MYNWLIMRAFSLVHYGHFGSSDQLRSKSEPTGKTIARFNEFLMSTRQLIGVRQLKLMPFLSSVRADQRSCRQRL
jgi:hypothetical protein